MPRKPNGRGKAGPKGGKSVRGNTKNPRHIQRDEFGRFVARGTAYTFDRRAERFVTNQSNGSVFTFSFHWTIPLDDSEIRELHRAIRERIALGKKRKHKFSQIRLLIETWGRIYETVFGKTDEKSQQWFGSAVKPIGVQNMKASLDQIIARVEDRTIDQGRAAWAVRFYVATFKLTK